MNPDYEDRILEASLEEVLGGNYPPDLSVTILQVWEQRQAVRSASKRPSPEPLAWPPASLREEEPVAPPACPVEIPARLPRTRRRRPADSSWLNLGVAASLLAVLFLVGLHVARTTPRLTTTGPEPVAEGLASGPVGRATADHADFPEFSGPAAAQVSGEDGEGESAADSPALLAEPRPEIAGQREPTRAGERESAAPPSIASPVRRVAPGTDREVVARIDRLVEETWRGQGIAPAAAADEATWCGRVYQRLIGRRPDAEELAQFLGNRSEDRRSELVSQLLDSDEHAAHWARTWTRVLTGPASSPAVGTPQERALRHYLVGAFSEEKPYDELAAALIAASGNYHPRAEDYDGAVGFLAMFPPDDHHAVTDRVARVFLGQQLSCVRCHDHPASDREQRDYWELNAFFRQLQWRTPAHELGVQLADGDFYGETGVVEDAEVFYQDGSGRLRVAYPRFAGETVTRSGRLAEVHRRRELASRLQASPAFATAAVNRVWSELLGYGLVEPVDDMGAHNPPLNAQLLEELGQQWAAHGFPMKRLVGWVALSAPFGLSDQPTPESWMDTPETGGRPLFARFYPPLPRAGPELYAHLMQALRNRPQLQDRGAAAGMFARRTWLRGESSLPQIIDTMGVEALPGPKWLDQLAKSPLEADQKVEHLFLSRLGREPTSREAMAARLLLADRLDKRVAIRELWQTLGSSNRATATRP